MFELPVLASYAYQVDPQPLTDPIASGDEYTSDGGLLYRFTKDGIVKYQADLQTVTDQINAYDAKAVVAEKQAKVDAISTAIAALTVLNDDAAPSVAYLKTLAAQRDALQTEIDEANAFDQQAMLSTAQTRMKAIGP